MKVLSRFVIQAFIPPFVVTFLVAWFVFVMQMFWLYIDDLVGKGLDNITIIKLLGYLAPTIVPLALPLGILLAGIMTFGNKAESSELTAVKSAGISLLRFAKPLILFVAGISGAAFLFNNYVLPQANLKFWSLLSDIRSTKPAVNIRAGRFYDDIPGYSIYIAKKDNDNKTIYDVLIYDHTSGKGNDKMIAAESGTMYASKDQKYLIFELYNGSRYEDRDGKNNNDKDNIQLDFKYWKKIFDLSSFAMQKNAETGMSGSEITLPNHRVQQKIDSCYITMNNYAKQNFSNFQQYNALTRIDTNSTVFLKNQSSKNSLKKWHTQLNDSVKSIITSSAQSSIRSLKGLSEIYKSDASLQQLNIARLNIEWHRKLTLAASCLILFLIGAPLGAIIRKGGFGMPFVAAVSFFVLYRFLTIFAEKLAEHGDVSPIVGMWGPPCILLAIAFILFYLANKDSKLFTKGYYSTLFYRFK